MPEQLEQTAPEYSLELPSSDASEKQRTLRNLGTAAALGGVAAAITVTEFLGATPDLPEVVEWTRSSSRHLVLGFLGSWAAASVFKKSFESMRKRTAAAGATVANFAPEIAQSASPMAMPEYAEFWATRNLPETGKDYAFALAGLGIYMFQNRRKDQ